MTPKILYHQKPGTTEFFYGEFPELLDTSDFEGGGSPCESYYERYDLECEACKEEAIKNGEITNINNYKRLLWESDYRIGNPISMYDWEKIILRDGDTFELPKGLKVEKFEQCIECGADLHEDCKNGPDGCDVKNRWFIRLVPDVANEDYILYQPVEDGIIGTHFGNSKEETQEELFRQIIEIFNKEHIKHGRPDYSELKSKFIIKAIDSIDLNKKP